MICIICNSNKNVSAKLNKFNGTIYNCNNCNFEFLFPQPDDNRLTEIYSSGYYDTWGIKTNERQLQNQKKKTFQARFDLIKNTLQKGDKILDCGCATGYLLDVAKENDYDPYGIDLSEFAANESIKKFGTSKIFCGKIEDAAFKFHPTKKFNAIFMQDYIEHVRDPKKTLELAFQMLNKEGSLVISTPKKGSTSHQLMGSKWSHYKEEHLFYFSFDALKKLLLTVGYSEIKEFAAYKYLSFDYINGHFNSYPHPFFTPVVNTIHRILPASLNAKLNKFLLGDLLVVATKK